MGAALDGPRRRRRRAVPRVRPATSPRSTERLDAIASRLEAVPDVPRPSRATRAVVPQVRAWQELEIESAADLPSFFDEIVDGRSRSLPDAERRRLGGRRRHAPGPRSPTTAPGCRTSLATGTDDWALGRERYDELVGLRAFDGLDADAILEIGERPARDEQGRPDPGGRARSTTARPRPTVIDRIKSDHPATFEEALDAYRDVMVRARQHLIDHDIATVPPDERIDVIATPEYLRNVIPFAAYFSPPKFDPRPEGHLHRHAVGRRRPERDARAQLQLDQQHEHPRGVSRATTSSCASRTATRR